ncbi:MAG: domain protein beta Propeller [Bryobacterales bacterium]|nr:domain protein beta Propeller [Bryobacterales bacterium]
MKRRAFISLLAGSAFAAETEKGKAIPAEARRYADPATELDVVRLTDAKHVSVLPASGQRIFGRRSTFLLYASDRGGSPQAFRMDLKSGESRQLTDAAALDTASLTLLPDERGFCYFDGPSLKQVLFGGLREREIYRAEGAAKVSVSDDGAHAVVAQGPHLRLVTLATGAAQTIAESTSPVGLVLARPRRTQAVYFRENGAAWLVNFDGQQHRPLKMEPVARVCAGMVQWNPSGRTFLYLRFPEDTRQPNTLREHTPDENADAPVGKTSQFVQFGVNGDSSVMVGASRSKASPAVLLFLRAARREFTLCEHKASDPRMVAPVFTPNSQHILFQSDRDGKPAIYRMRVDKLVEETS